MCNYKTKKKEREKQNKKGKRERERKRMRKGKEKGRKRGEGRQGERKRKKESWQQKPLKFSRHKKYPRTFNSVPNYSNDEIFREGLSLITQYAS